MNIKQLLTAVILLMTAAASAQHFEGTITWSLKTEMTGQNQKIDKNTTQSQQALKQMQEKMKDPAFKEQMEKNPQLKAQMGQMIQQMEAANSPQGVDSMFPTSMTIMMKNNNTLTTMAGGMSNMMGNILYLKGKDQTYSINNNSKTYMLLPKQDSTSKAVGKYKVTKTEESIKVLNYNCTKYIVTSQAGNKSVTQDIWATTELKEFDPKALSRANLGKNGNVNIFYNEIDGFPMKIETQSSDMNMSMEVSEIKKQTLNSSSSFWL